MTAPKMWVIRGVASFEEDNLIVLYYFSVSEIWPNKRVGLWREGPNNMGVTVLIGPWKKCVLIH